MSGWTGLCLPLLSGEVAIRVRLVNRFISARVVSQSILISQEFFGSEHIGHQIRGSAVYLFSLTLSCGRQWASEKLLRPVEARGGPIAENRLSRVRRRPEGS